MGNGIDLLKEVIRERIAEKKKQEASMTVKKKCTKCGVEKPADPKYFYRKGKDGLNNWCKECHIESSRKSSKSVKTKKKTKTVNHKKQDHPIITKPVINQSAIIQYGWICPVCGSGNAPFSFVCHCMVNDKNQATY